MFEVEKKFVLNPKSIQVLTNGAEFISQKVFSDSYYDDEEYSLTSRDWWLRLRADQFELKVTMNQNIGMGKRKLDQYFEITTDEEICQYLKIPSAKITDEYLRKFGLTIFGTITTTRKKYKKNEFVVDLDEIDFGYTIGEIELLVNDQSEMKSAESRIIDFAQKNQLELLPVRGKIVEYIYRNNPKHYHVLVKAGVVEEIM